MLIDKINACTSSINELSTLRSNALSLKTYETSVNKLTTVDTLVTEKSVKLFERFGIFTKAELESRVEILYEIYAKTINIEALTMIDMASKQIIPAVISYTKELAEDATLQPRNFH